MTNEILHNPSAGEILKEEFIDELGLSQNSLAKALGVPANRIHQIVKGQRSITADSDLRLCKFFGLSEGYFLRLQASHQIMEAKHKLKEEVKEIPFYLEYKSQISMLR